MQLNYKYINLHTEYSAEGPIPHEMQRKPCYGTITGELKRHTDPLTQIYHIRIYNTPHKLQENGNNYCFIDINKYLNYLKEIFPFEYDITEEKKDHRVVLNLTISKLEGIFHCYILTCIRPLYEFPYSWAMHDAIHFYESGECNGFNIIDCFNLCLVSQNKMVGGGHSFVYNSEMLVKPMTVKELLNSYKTGNQMNYWYPHVCKKIETISYNSEDHIENFINTYHRRHKLYLKNYNKLIEHV